MASLCRVIKCDKEVTFHVVRPCQEWEINKLIHGVFKVKWNLTYSRQVSRARPNDSGHKIHVGCYSHTRSLITGLGRSFLRQAGVEFAQITLFTGSMLATYTATQGAWSQVLGSSPSRSQKSVQIVNKEVITTQPHNFFRSKHFEIINANCDSVTTVFSECCDWEKNELNNWLFLMKHIKSIFQWAQKKTFQMGIFTSPSILLSWWNWGACSSAPPINPWRCFWNSRHARGSGQQL